ncbi:MAG: single-stranded DNA-binding protein [Acidobacteriota bacterium]
MDLTAIIDHLVEDVERLTFSSPVAFVYNPLLYARAPLQAYVDRYARQGATTLLLGMNPGPFGMAQTGIPFGAVDAVRRWLEIEEAVDLPPATHPKRPIEGFGCQREEVSGRRLWSWAREHWGTPDRFFEDFFVWNYCPLLFLEASGRNLTPDKLKADERRALLVPCDAALRSVATELEIKQVVGVGAWAERRAQAALSDLDLPVGRVLHPSPASPIANRGWAEQATRQLREQGLPVPGG